MYKKLNLKFGRRYRSCFVLIAGARFYFVLLCAFTFFSFLHFLYFLYSVIWLDRPYELPCKIWSLQLKKWLSYEYFCTFCTFVIFWTINTNLHAKSGVCSSKNVIALGTKEDTSIVYSHHHHHLSSNDYTVQTFLVQSLDNYLFLTFNTQTTTTQCKILRSGGNLNIWHIPNYYSINFMDYLLYYYQSTVKFFSGGTPLFCG